jgi:hypothetical protein
MQKLSDEELVAVCCEGLVAIIEPQKANRVPSKEPAG